MLKNNKTKAFLILLLAAAIYGGCKKTEKVTVDIVVPKSTFQTLVTDISFKQKKASTIAYTDSNFYFKNLSESGADITYRWDFGDGSKSTDKNPAHAYAQPGKYTVKLITTLSDKASDTSSVELTTIIAERIIKLTVAGKTGTTSAIQIKDLRDGGYLLLGTVNSINGAYDKATTFLMKLDKGLKQTALKMLDANIKLSSMSTCSDGNYIFLGSTLGKTTSNELIKMSADGALLWSKVISDDSFTDAQQTGDNGFILTGVHNIPDQYGNLIPHSLVIKTDATGGIQWKKSFENELVTSGAANTLAQSDGYVVAANKRRDPLLPGYCEYCDSVCIAKLDMQGKLKWHTTVGWGLNNETGSQVFVTALKNNTYAIVSRSATGLYIFSNTGTFLDRKLMRSPAVSLTTTIEDNIVVQQQDWGNGFRSAISGYSNIGAHLWDVGINNFTTMPNGGAPCCGFDSWPIVVNALKSGGVIFLSNLVDINDYHYEIVIDMIDANGKIM
ncbi:PKD domain-containing protein [Mucilaginibacter sp. CAU 1740]|uniref:PKD domain-containing protein n=1 Tax=Mucilaginibacter sp. CAU 1740 TaxID=3140365 RepID=UPI00325BFD3E